MHDDEEEEPLTCMQLAEVFIHLFGCLNIFVGIFKM
jgi:hypothetical protein